MQTRRDFLRQATCSTAFALLSRSFAAKPADPTAYPPSFFLIGDTHYCADDESMTSMQTTSADYNHRLIDWLNKLPGTEFPAEIGSGAVPTPDGVIHAGDMIDNGDKGPAKIKMMETEWSAFTADWGLNGNDGRLRWCVREVYGNHDAPHGDTLVIDEMKKRNTRRGGVTNVANNGLHYSWDWGNVHFVALGIIVGATPEVRRQRRYAALDSLAFLQQDLAESVGTSGRPVMLVHHIDVARYSEPIPDDKVLRSEWDYADVHAYHATLKPYRIAGIMCGHTHTRNLFRWNGTKNTRAEQGIAFLNTDNAAHFGGPAQAFLHVQVAEKELRIREFATKDGWQTAAWTPQRWTFPIQS